MSVQTKVKHPAAFNADDFVRRTASFVQQNPDLAARAYAAAADRLRREAARARNLPEKFQLQAFALEFDTLAAQATVPEVEPFSGELVQVYEDDPNDEIETEFDGLIADIAASKVDEQGRPRSEFAALAVQEQLRQARENEAAPPVQVNPVSALRSDTLWGRQVLVQFGGSAGSGSFLTGGSTTTGFSGAVVAKAEDEVVRWEGKSGESRVVTVSIYQVLRGVNATFPAITAGGTPVVNYSYRPYWRATWGAGAGTIPCEAYGDVGRGCQFTLACSYINVSVGMAAPVSGGTAGSMVLGGNFGFFTAARQAPVYYTQYVDALAPAGTQTLVIPEFAQTVEAIIATTPGNFTFQIQRTDGAALGNIATTAPQARGNAVTLPGDAYQILVTNNAGTSQSCEVVYGLAL